MGTNNMSRIKIGQIGLGHNHGEGKMAAVRKFPELFDVVGYAEPDDAWVAQRGGLSVYDGLPRMDTETLIARCDALLIETDVWNLTKTAQRCVAHGKHIHMDKPAGGSLTEFGALLRDAEAQHLVLQMGYMYRYNPAVRHALALAKSGALGEIRSIVAEMSTAHSPSFRDWLRHFDGGTFYIFGSHLVDLIVSALGTPQRVSACFQRTGADGVDVVDQSFALLRYERAMARVFVSSVEVNGWGERQFSICGSDASVHIRPLENPVCVTYSDRSIADNAYRDRKKTLDFPDWCNANRYDDMMQAFAAYVHGEAQNPYSYAYEYAVQKTLCDIIHAGKEEAR